MPEFLKLIPPIEALEIFLTSLSPEVQTEWVQTSHALGRVTCGNIRAPHSLPTFNRSTVDGYALRAEDTYGSSDSVPAYLTVIGEILMGTEPKISLKEGECAVIHTGGMLPLESDAVIMVEFTQPTRQGEIEALKAVAIGENILKEGEDVAAGQEVISTGTILRPAEIGGLAALGINRVEVARQPRVAIISSGDEIVPLDAPIQPGQVRDVNTSTLSALINQKGGIPVSYGILPDNLDALAKAASQALIDCDVVIFTAGSSASVRDLTAEVINTLGKPGVLVHGVNVRPGKPTILAACAPAGKEKTKPVIGLPGNPVSALVIAGLFLVPVLRKLLGLPDQMIQPTILAQLALNLPSQAGREDWISVKLVTSDSGWIAQPVFEKSNLIFGLVRADGMICIPPEATGLDAGTIVEVFPY